MRRYIISYSIAEPLCDYTELKEYIKLLGWWQHPSQYTWYVMTENKLDCDKVGREARNLLHMKHDNFFIGELADWGGYMPNAFWTWMNSDTAKNDDALQTKFTDALAKVNEADDTTTNNKCQRDIALKRYASFLQHAGIENNVRAMSKITWDAWRLHLMRSDFSVNTVQSYCCHLKRLISLWNERVGKGLGMCIDTSDFKTITKKME